METQHPLHGGILHTAVGDHLAGAAALFLGGLEKQLDRTGQLIFHALEHLGHAHEDCGVDIMAAGVHHTGILRRIFHIRFFCYRQRIHIRTEQNPGKVFLCHQIRIDTVLANTDRLITHFR